jgi:hypothetical protein
MLMFAVRFVPATVYVCAVEATPGGLAKAVSEPVVVIVGTEVPLTAISFSVTPVLVCVMFALYVVAEVGFNRTYIGVEATIPLVGVKEIGEEVKPEPLVSES